MQRSRGYKHETAYLLPGVLLTFLWTINPPLKVNKLSSENML